MSSPNMLFLRWDGFVANAVSELKESQNESEFFDVTVVAGDGGKVQANKLVLATASTFFFQILKENPDPDPLIYLGGVSSEMLQYLMDFMYTGAVKIPQDDANDFLDIAVELGFKGMIGILASEKTGGDKTKSRSTTPGLRKKHVTFAEISPTPKPPIPPGVAPLTPATHQNQVSGGVHSPMHTDISSSQSVTSITPVLHHGRHTGDSHGLSSNPHSVHKVTPSSQRQTTAQGTPVMKLLQSQIETPSHYHSTFPEVISEEEQDITMFKVEVGDANDYNVHYDTNEHGEQFIGRFSQRRLHKNGGKEISKDQKMKDPAINTRAMDFNCELNVMEAPDGQDEQTQEDYDYDEDYDPNGDYDLYERYDPDEDNDRMISTREQDDQIAWKRNDIKQCYVKIEKIKCSETFPKFFKKNPIGEKPYKFLICYKTFKHLSASKLHNRSHTGERPFQCSVCFKKFSILSSLKRHTKRHTSELPYQCSVCTKTFSQSTTLKTHMNIYIADGNGSEVYRERLARHNGIHVGSSKYQCKICKEIIANFGNLKCHIEAKHFLSSGHMCDTCGKLSKTLRGLRAHKSEYHKNQ